MKSITKLMPLILCAFLGMQVDICMGMNNNYKNQGANYRVQRTNQIPDPNILAQMEYDVEHIVRFDYFSYAKTAHHTPTGGHFAYYFTPFRYKSNKFLVTTNTNDSVMVGWVVPAEILAKICCMGQYTLCKELGYGKDWVQVVWFNNNPYIFGSKTLFSQNHTLDSVTKKIKSATIDKEHSSYDNGYTRTALKIDGFELSITIAHIGLYCHTIYPFFFLNNEKQDALNQKCKQLFIDTNEYNEIWKTAFDTYKKAQTQSSSHILVNK